MKNAKREMKREGFTLVELLIVIVVIGVLSAMMMLSSTEAVSSAKAADIVSDLRNLKTAALAYYADNLSTAEASGFSLKTIGDATTNNALAKYMGGDGLGSYKFCGNQNPGTWCVWIQVSDSKVFDKLKSRSSTVGGLKYAKSAPADGMSSSDLSNTTNFDNTNYVGMLIR